MTEHSADVTPLMKAWKADAQEFEIPEATQRGLAFMLALDTVFNPPSQDSAEQVEFVQRLSKNAPKIPEGMGKSFNDVKIEELLAEFAHKAHPEFKPRVVHTTSSGEEIRCFKKPEKDKLPEFDPDHMKLADWDNAVSSLFHQIGECIDEDIEGAYLGGFHFSSMYYPMDNKGTAFVARMPNSARPPQFMWFSNCLGISVEEIQKSNGMQKVLNCFLGAILKKEEDLYKTVCWFSDLLHYVDSGEKREVIWKADLPSFTSVVSTMQLELQKLDSSQDWLPELATTLRQKGIEVPPNCSNDEEAKNLIAEHVKNEWGYEVLPIDKDLYSSQQWVRRACVVYASTIFSVLNPTWNLACAKK